jgi:hypothetical protein
MVSSASQLLDNTLIATFRLSSLSRAWKTIPIPPRPSSRTNSYFPPLASAIWDGMAAQESVGRSTVGSTPQRAPQLAQYASSGRIELWQLPQACGRPLAAVRAATARLDSPLRVSRACTRSPHQQQNASSGKMLPRQEGQAAVRSVDMRPV